MNKPTIEGRAFWFEVRCNKWRASASSWEQALSDARTRFEQEDCEWVDVYQVHSWGSEWKGGASYLFSDREMPAFYGAMNIDLGSDRTYD